MATKKTTEKKEVAKKIEGLSVKEAKAELQTLIIKVRTGEETNNKKVSEIKKYIARELTKLNNKSK